MDCRKLVEKDRRAVEAYLSARAAETMFLAANLERCGFDDEESRYGGEFLGAFLGTELRGVVQLARLGTLLLIASNPDAVEVLAREALKRDFVPARFMGMKNELEDFVVRYLEERPLEVRHSSDAKLQQLTLDGLNPQPMTGLRAATTDDLDVLVPWQRAFEIEEQVSAEADLEDADIARRLTAKISEGRKYLLFEGDQPVSMASVSAAANDMIQLGGIYTPPERRGQGHATRLVAALCHFHLSALGASRVVLMVQEGNEAARRTYEKVGFTSAGTYRYVFIQ